MMFQKNVTDCMQRQQKIYQVTNHLNDILASDEPLFQFRPLWITHTELCRLPSRLEVFLPNYWNDQQQITELIDSVVDNGYNALIIGSQSLVTDTATRISWNEFQVPLQLMRAKGIQVGLRFHIPEMSREMADFFERINDLAAFFDFVVVHQGEISIANTDRLEQEVCLEEIRSYEKSVQKPILYVLETRNLVHAKRQSEWLMRLAHQVNLKTIIAFSAVAEPYRMHPFFDELSKSDVLSFVRLLPVINIRKDILLIENILGRQHQGRLFGVASKLGFVPEKASYDALKLWLCGQRQWRALAFEVF
ncbi:MAG TPA: hypothetical protein VN457_03325, partial [Chlamydiales bacterium]|nr:hypothetical protein [Chlamydiales bacterium]